MVGQELILASDYDSLRLSAQLAMDKRIMDALRQARIDERRGHLYRWMGSIDDHGWVIYCHPCLWGTHAGCLNVYYNNSRCSCTHEPGGEE